MLRLEALTLETRQAQTSARELAGDYEETMFRVRRLASWINDHVDDIATKKRTRMARDEAERMQLDLWTWRGADVPEEEAKSA